MVNVLTKELTPYQWAIPETLDIPPDELQGRLDFYQDSIVYYSLNKGIITTKQVSARDVTLALLSEVSFSSGFLPPNTLWWKQARYGPEVGLWRPPQVWRVALQEDAFKPATRFKLPMPGLIFLCSKGRAPSVFAVKKRPRSPGEFIYHAPLFNVFEGGTTCSGTTHYPQDVEKIPEAFFISFFTLAANHNGRSQKYPNDLLKLWHEIDGKKKYPLGDLVKIGTIGDLLK